MVKAWEVFLIGEKLDPGEPDGMFTDKTAEATRAFQAKTKVEADGVVGRQTMRKALERGFELMEEPAADATSSNFPPRPSFPPLVSNAQRRDLWLLRLGLGPAAQESGAHSDPRNLGA